jgi:hypothetical protein
MMGSSFAYPAQLWHTSMPTELQEESISSMLTSGGLTPIDDAY